PDPEIALFLHGPETGPPDVGIVWRADLDTAPPEQWPQIVALAPPDGRERLSVGFAAARRWLAGLAPEDFGDVEGVAAGDEGTGNASRKILRWRGARDRETRTIPADELRPGDTIVVAARYGGCDSEGWNPGSTHAVYDLAEAAAGERGERLL